MWRSTAVAEEFRQVGGEEPDKDGAPSADVRRDDKEESIKNHEAMLQLRDLKFTQDQREAVRRGGHPPGHRGRRRGPSARQQKEQSPE